MFDRYIFDVRGCVRLVYVATSLRRRMTVSGVFARAARAKAKRRTGAGYRVEYPYLVSIPGRMVTAMRREDA
jgi:hypothetical protein